MESLTREPVSMNTNTQPSSVNGSAGFPPVATTTGLTGPPIQTKVQFADNLINSKPGSVSIPTIPNNSSVTTTTTTTAPAAPTPNSTPIVNSSIKPTNNLISSVNPPQTSVVNSLQNSAGNPPQTQSTRLPQSNSSANTSANKNLPAAAPATTASAITNPPVNSEAINVVKAPATTTTTTTATTIPPPATTITSKTTSTNSVAASPTPPAKVTNGQSKLKTDSIEKSDPTMNSSSMNKGKSEDIHSNASKENKSGTETRNMNGSIDKGICNTSQSQDRAAASAKQYSAPDVVGRDVQELCEKVEKSGLCAPANKDSFPGNIASVLSTPPAARPNTAESVVGNPTAIANKPSPGKLAKAGSGGGTSASGTAKAPATTPTTREPRPSTATPKAGTGTLKTGSASTPVASRNSTARAASAKFSPTSPNANNISNGKSSTPTAATNGNGHYDDKSRAKSAPKLRPTSSLYRPTASSALKGIATPPPIKASKSLSGPNNNKTSKPKMGDAGNGGSGEGKAATLKEQFAAFSRFGDTSSDGKHISLTNCDKWMKQAHVIDGKKITTTDTSISFKKLFKTAKKVGFEDFKKYIEELATNKKVEPQEIIDKLTNCGAPGLSSATRASGGGVYERLTDTSRYTGSHKERFDASGKGRGIEGRRDVQDDSGYTASFKSKLADGSSPAK